MKPRQWLWYAAACAPLPVWIVSVALLVLAAGLTLRSVGGSDDEGLRRQLAVVTDTVNDLQLQLGASRGPGAGEQVSSEDSEEFLRLLLNHDCGVQRGIQMSREDGKPVVVFEGGALEALCVMRSVGQISGGIRRFRRRSGGAVDFVWEGREQ